MTGRPPHPTSSTERAIRARRIAQARAEGESWAAISRRFKLSERQARRAEAEYLRSVGELLPAEVGSAIETMLATYRWADEQLVALGEEADNDSVRVAAVARRVDVAERRLVLLARTGRLPSTPGQWSTAMEAPAAAQAFIDLAERQGLDLDKLEVELGRIAAARPAARNRNGAS
jgi:hypothetical protein